jgi:hypothetical protein
MTNIVKNEIHFYLQCNNNDASDMIKVTMDSHVTVENTQCASV